MAPGALIRTGGGAFDRNEEPIAFLALSSANMEAAEQYASHVLVAMNNLLIPAGLEKFEKLLDSGRHKVFLDSGIYTLNSAYQRDNPGVNSFQLPPSEMPGFEELFDKYVAVARKYESKLWGYVELDQGGYAWKPKIRARLHAVGLNPMPVYHPLDDPVEYFDELASSYDRICVGVGARQRSWIRKHLIATTFERARRYPKLWIHLLGVWPNQWARSMPFQSYDASTWTEPVRYGIFAEHSDGKHLGFLPKNFMYRLGAAPDADDGGGKALLIAMSQAHMAQRNFRDGHAQRSHLGLLAG